MGDVVQRGLNRIRVFQSPEMDFQLLRTIGNGAYGGSSIGECLAAAGKIDEGRPESWVRAFAELAEQVEQDAVRRLARRHLVSARDAYLRAAEYYRSAEYYSRIRLESSRLLGLKSRECFMNALDLMDIHAQDLEIPFEHGALAAYFLSPDSSGVKRKTVMIMSGFDGTNEELMAQGGWAALERGYNVLVFAGPGQVSTMRRHLNLTFRPDYETVLEKVVDWLSCRSEVDFQRLGLIGISFGGYFAARAASREHRIQALVANSPIVDLYSYLLGFMGGEDQVDMTEDVRLEELPEIPDEAMPPEINHSLDNLIVRFGKESWIEAMNFIKEFKIAPELLGGISCPCLALMGAGEGGETLKQARTFVDGVGGSAVMVQFTPEQGAEAHCQVNNARLGAAETFDWMDEIFK